MEFESKDVISVDDFNKNEKQRVEDIVQDLDVNDSQEIIKFGSEAQKNLSKFSDTILSEVKNKDSGEVGKILNSLMSEINSVDVDNLNQRSKIPVIGGLFSSAKGNVKKFIGQYEKVSVQIENIVDELNDNNNQLLKDVTVLDGLFKKNLEYLKEIEIYIVAGEEKLDKIRNYELPKLKEEAEKTNDQLALHKLNDLNQSADRLEKKLHDLRLSRTIALQALPQIRLIQNNNNLIVEKIQSSIFNTIPLWKNQMVIAISLFRQDKALKLQQNVTKTTNNLLQKNSEMLKNSTIQTARESEKGIVEIETLKKVNRDLIDTIDETLKIQEEGRKKRREAEKEIENIENELKNRLVK